jgi:uncharacterized protein involved in outer membrane biogenesis
MTFTAILLVGLVAAAAIFVYTADYNRNKGLVQKAVEEATGSLPLAT